jgi:hypothetical protein
MSSSIPGRREFMLRGVRFNYVYAFQPQVNRKTGKKTYGVQILLPSNDPQWGQITQAIKDVAAEKWGDAAPQILAQLKLNNKIVLKNGTTNKPGNPDYAGQHFMQCNHKGPFRVVETRGGVNVELTESDNRPRSGDYGNISVAIYAHTFEEGKGIFADVMGIQYVRKGTPLGTGGRIASVDEFGVEPSDADGAVPAASTVVTPTSGGVDDLMG